MMVLGPRYDFACGSCGSPSIRFPDDIHDAAELHCAGCGTGLGSWSAFKERARQVILEEIAKGQISATPACSDTLIVFEGLDLSAR
ncbi:hypothetical protein [Microvirga arabica]|uniref:hypothetical protein n=1 Tax=Microvirga arabica TaxID=1128671 RepID=UPI00193ABCA1|nr:hypothetical protein [Microvirga arabica]MBM1171287.1 hypothetical protein [Microvirga arabica]